MTTHAAPSAPVTRPLLAAVWMLGATLSFTAMAVAGREIAVELDTFELMLYRSLIGIVVVVSVATLAGTIGQVNTRDLRMHGIRNVGHFTGQNLWFYAVGTIPLAQVVSFEFTTPFWVALAAPFFLGERWTKARAFAVALGFAGVLMVAQPGRVAIEPGVLAAALCAIGFAVSYIATKRLAQSGHSITTILFWLTVMQAVFAAGFAGWDGDVALPSSDGWPFVVVVALAGLSAHFCLTTALTLAPATLVAPLDFIRLPIVALVGWLIYAETVNTAVVVGAAAILTANLVNMRAEARARAALRTAAANAAT